jgi:autotransporter translocation and assembly factor TamB
MKKRKTKAYIFYGIILLLMLVIVVILRTDVVENLFKGRIEKFITDKTGIRVSIGRIDISILSSSVTLSSLLIKGDASYKAEIGKLTVVFEPPSILKKKPQLKVVYINDAKVSLVINKKLPGKMHGKTTAIDINKIAAELPVTIQHVVVNNTALSISMPASSTDVVAKDVSMNVYPELAGKSVNGVVDIKGLSLSRYGSTITLSDSEFNGAIINRDISINSLRIRSNSFSFVVNGSVNDYDNPYLDLRLKASVDNIQQFNTFIKTLPVSIPELSGDYKFDGSVKGSILNPSSSGDVGFRDMEIGHIRGGTGDLSYVFKSQKLYIKKADVSIAKGTVKFNGDIDFSNNELPAEFSLDLKGISFGEMLYALTVPNPYVDADITGRIEVKGEFNPVYFSGDFDLQFIRFSVYDDFFRSRKKNTIMVVKPVDIRSGLIITNQCAYITETTIKSSDSLLHADTALYFTGAMFSKFDSTRMDMNDVSPIAYMPYTGVGSVKGYVAGPFNDIVIHGDVSFEDYSMEHIKLGNVTGTINFDKNILSIKSVRAVKGDSRMYVDGGIQFTKDVELHMDAKLQPVSLKDIADNIGYKFTRLEGMQTNTRSFLNGFTVGGYVTGSVRFDGPIGTMSGYADLSFLHPDVYFQSFDSGYLKMTMDHGVFNIDNAVFKKGEDNLHIGGHISENGNIAVDFDTERFGIDNMNTIVRLDPHVKAVSSFAGQITGTVYNPIGSMNLKLKNITYDNVGIPDCSASVSFSDRVFSTIAEVFDGSLNIKAELDIKDGYPFRLRTQFDKFNAHPVLSILSGIGLTSDVTGTLWLVGRLKDLPDSLVGYVYLNNVSFGANFAVFENDKPVFIDIAKDNIYFREFSIKGKNSLVSLKGFFNLKGSIDTLVDADIDLSYLPVFTNIFAGANGKFKINARIYGEKDNVLFNGNADLNGNATLAEQPISVSGLHISVLMAGNNIIIKDMTGNINSGTMSGNGRIVMEGVLPKLFDISLNLKGISFVYANTIPMRLEGDLDLQGNYPQPVLEGNIKILDATYTDYINWEDEILKFQRRRYEPQIIEQKKGHPLKLNINVGAENSIFIDNNIINSILSAELKITGDVDNPVIVGNISTSDGKLYYRSTVFNIDNAVVTYTSEHLHNPFVDLRASTSQQFMVNNEYTEYSIYLTIAGELDKLNVSLTSYPPNLDEMDIISLLTYGVTPADLMKSGISSAAAYEVGTAVGSKLAKDIFSELVGNQNLNKFRRLFWIDNIQVEPYYPIGASTTSIRLTVTKRLTNDLDIMYSYDLSGYNLQRFQSEYRLSRRLYFVGSWDNNISTMQSNTSNSNIGNLGGDLKYKFEF